MPCDILHAATNAMYIVIASCKKCKQRCFKAILEAQDRHTHTHTHNHTHTYTPHALVEQEAEYGLEHSMDGPLLAYASV
jgi:hypothetical protein